MNRASIGIFQKSIEQSQNKTQPLVPDEIFEAALRVSKNHGCECVKTNEGLYIVKYSESGPWESQMNDEWFPVYIAKAVKWSSGGITKQEMDYWVSNKTQTESADKQNETIPT